MGNRGSKSVKPLGLAVKEQRVDGSYPHEVECSQNRPSSSLIIGTSWGLRCILMDFERNYPIKNLSNHERPAIKMVGQRAKFLQKAGILEELSQ